MASNVLDLEQSILLLELEPPFDKRAVQLARRRMAKLWHPDLAPPGKQLEHERHLKAINEAADQLEQLAETSRGGKVSRNAVKVSAAAARRAKSSIASGRGPVRASSGGTGHNCSAANCKPSRLVATTCTVEVSVNTATTRSATASSSPCRCNSHSSPWLVG